MTLPTFLTIALTALLMFYMFYPPPPPSAPCKRTNRCKTSSHSLTPTASALQPC